MNKRGVRVAAILCLLFVAQLLVQQMMFVFSTSTPDDSRIAAFVEHYRVTSSIEIGATAVIGAIVSVSVLLRQTPLRVAALAVFCAFQLWHVYVSVVASLFSPPLGDGSLTHAAAMWWRIHSGRAWIHIASILFLTVMTFFLGFQAYAIRKRTKNA